MILTIAIPSPLRRLFDYLLPVQKEINPSILRPGIRISVPFGHQKAVIGILIRVSPQTDTPSSKMRPIHDIAEDMSLDEEILALCEWCASYYHYPLGEVCHLALPALLRKSLPIPERKELDLWTLTDTGKDCEPSTFGRAKKQLALWELAQKHTIINPNTLKAANISRTIVNSLLEKGILEKTSLTAVSDSLPQEASNNISKHSDIQPNAEQLHAINQVDLKHFHTYLLDGVTGSGKTEVYLQTIARVIANGKQVLVLVPEIGLTPQTLERFQKRFHIPIALHHSGMTDRQRYDVWLDAKEGRAPIIIGTRSAIFMPLNNLGLIIVDEEHDLSYKQQEGVRYSARDLAVIRGHKRNIPVMLGSATPSLETLHNATSGRFSHLQLTQRANTATLPIIRCVDQKQSTLAPHILLEIKQTLDRDQQVLVFINRRGYAPTLICQECGWMSPCDNCDSRMTVHHFQQRNAHLHCHHCDKKTALPSQCPSCHSSRLQPLGQGTQRSEEELQQHFPTTSIIRIDRDSMSRKGELETALATINQGRPCILVGTQMLAKGHHFSKVSLAVILGLDNTFFSSDFRGAERMGQLLTQVAGRAGREHQQGTVLIQTQFASHPHLQQLLNEGYGSLAQQLLAERKFSQMPPYEYMALVRCHAQQPSLAMEFLHRAKHLAHQILPPNNQLQYLGPLPATIEKRNNRYYYQLQIKTQDRRKLHILLTQLCFQLEQQRQVKGLHWLVDVDPQDI